MKVSELEDVRLWKVALEAGRSEADALILTTNASTHTGLNGTVNLWWKDVLKNTRSNVLIPKKPA